MSLLNVVFLHTLVETPRGSALLLVDAVDPQVVVVAQIAVVVVTATALAARVSDVQVRVQLGRENQAPQEHLCETY